MFSFLSPKFITPRLITRAELLLHLSPKQEGILIYQNHYGFMVNHQEIVHCGINPNKHLFYLLPLERFLPLSGRVIFVKPKYCIFPSDVYSLRLRSYVQQGRSYTLSGYHPLDFIGKNILESDLQGKEMRKIINFIKRPTIINWRPYFSYYEVETYWIN